jgi:hypothetical protein
MGGKQKVGRHTMKPPSISPKSARQAKKDLRPSRKACMLATRLHDILEMVSVREAFPWYHSKR